MGYINYTTDGGETWSDSIPVWVDGLTVSATITVPVKDSYQYRFSTNSYVDGTATAFTATSNVYTADDPSGIDAVDADGDNAPVDYTTSPARLWLAKSSSLRLPTSSATASM